MEKPIFDSRGTEFKFIQNGQEKPVYTVYGKNEKHARKNLLGFLRKIGKSHIYEDIKLLN